MEIKKDDNSADRLSFNVPMMVEFEQQKKLWEEKYIKNTFNDSTWMKKKIKSY